RILRNDGAQVVLLDGDDLRSIFARRWGYEREERVELGQVYFRLANHLSSQGLVVIIAAVAMYDEVRHWVRRNIPRHLEVFLNVPGEILLERDAKTKHLYAALPHLTDMYDAPDGVQISLDNFGGATPDSVAAEIVRQYQTHPRLGADKGKSVYWDDYYHGVKGVSSPSPFALFVAEKLPPRQKILEVGCGNGRDASFFGEHGHEVTAVDNSAAAVELCQKLHHDYSTQFLAGTLKRYSGEWAGRFDLVYSRFVLHAMTETEEVEMLQAAHRALRANGQILLECRSINDPLAREGEVISPTERIAGHYRRFIIRDELRDRLVSAGFEITYETEANGLAVFKDEDPVVIRIKAIKSDQGDSGVAG
ncbi:MAG: methyltransferase domain-containing protein, partial [Blastocatellia bacterium]|nr:methyltransferase domain-containing protein [Blastocatellia bacterium]